MLMGGASVFTSPFRRDRSSGHAFLGGYGGSESNWHQAEPLILKVLHGAGDACFHQLDHLFLKG